VGLYGKEWGDMGKDERRGGGLGKGEGGDLEREEWEMVGKGFGEWMG
jgi:hypothetical protein